MLRCATLRLSTPRHRSRPVRGDRIINEAQANIVRRIFRDYAAGKSVKTIAFALNKDGIPAPSGGHWGFSTINGNPKRRNGILNNEIYIGKIVWNRQRFVKDPDTGKRQPGAVAVWFRSFDSTMLSKGDELWAREERMNSVRMRCELR